MLGGGCCRNLIFVLLQLCDVPCLPLLQSVVPFFSVPDYRGPAGAYTVSNFKPMSHQQFMASDANRARYWARSFAGWYKFSSVRPNAAHEGIARLQHSGAHLLGPGCSAAARVLGLCGAAGAGGRRSRLQPVGGAASCMLQL